MNRVQGLFNAPSGADCLGDAAMALKAALRVVRHCTSDVGVCVFGRFENTQKPIVGFRVAQ